MGDFGGSTPGLPPPGGTDPIGGLTGYIGAIGSAAGTGLLALESWVAGALSTVAGFLGSIFNKIWSLFGRLRAFLKHLHATWFAHIFRDAWRKVMALRDWLRHTFGPILDTIHRIRRYLDWQFNTFVKPILDFLQRLRRVLVLFRLLHFKFATSLDRYLAGLETRIEKPLLEARAALNTLADWIDWIIDPTGLISHGLFIGSVIRSLGELFALLHNAQLLPGPPGAPIPGATPANYYDRAVNRGRLDYYAKLGPTEDDEQIRKELVRAWTEMGYKV